MNYYPQNSPFISLNHTVLFTRTAPIPSANAQMGWSVHTSFALHAVCNRDTDEPCVLGTSNVLTQFSLTGSLDRRESDRYYLITVSIYVSPLQITSLAQASSFPSTNN